MESSGLQAQPSSSSSAVGFKMPKTKGLNRPGSWFSNPNHSSHNNTTSGLGSHSTNSPGPNSPNPFIHPPSFKSPFPSSKGKHKLSPSPSPRQPEDDFVMISPIRPHSDCNNNTHLQVSKHDNWKSGYGENDQLSTSMMRTDSGSSSPFEDSPTPACGMANATARLQLGDDSPIRRVPGQSRSLLKASKTMGTRGMDDDPGVFLSTSNSGQNIDCQLNDTNHNHYGPNINHPNDRQSKLCPSPLKFSMSTGMIDLEDGEESPQLPPTPSMGNSTTLPPQPLFPPLRASQSQDCQSGMFKASTSGMTTLGSTSKVRIETESKIPRLSTSHPLRARASTDADRGGNPVLMSSKKIGSLDQMVSKREEPGGTFGGGTINHVKKQRSSVGPSSSSGMTARQHRKTGSGDHAQMASVTISRSFGHKSGLTLSLSPGLGLTPLPDFSYSNSSLSSISTSTRSLTPPLSAFSPAEPPIFEDVKPLQEAFESAAIAVSRKFKPRDSGVSMGGDDGNKSDSPAIKKIPPPSTLKPTVHSGRQPKRPSMLKRTSSMGDERNHIPDLETPLFDPSPSSGWPSHAPAQRPFDFLGLGESGSTALGLAFSNGAESAEKLSMPGTPVKKSHFVHPSAGGMGMRVGHSISQPTLGSGHGRTSNLGDLPIVLGESTKTNLPAAEKRRSSMPSSNHKSTTMPLSMAKTPHELHLTLTTSSSSPASPSPSSMDTDEQSPTVRVGGMGKTLGHPMGTGGMIGTTVSRVGMLRRLSSGNGSADGSADGAEEEGTPTKDGGARTVLMARPNENDSISILPPSPLSRQSHHNSATQTTLIPKAKTTTASILPRLSLPVFQAPKVHRKLNHRQSHPPPGTNGIAEEDLYEKNFITLDTLGKGAFSTVLKAQERHGDGIYAVKRARGVFDGVKDRLRHLEEVDILRHLSKDQNPHVIHFVDAWEQNRQLFIQTELCLGSLAFFLEEYGRVVERLDEGRVWKIVSELSDGINHIHSSGVIHFDIKPANILISPKGSLKIADFGLATRWPRLEPTAILEGSGLGGSAIGLPTTNGKLEREGDRVYMPPEMLRGEFVMAADIFSFGLVILEVSTNICVPDGGAAWQALRSDDFSVVDLTPLSPALVDLITKLMQSDPSARPTIGDVVQHPVVVRAGRGKEALAPEDPKWLVEVLTGGQRDSGFVGLRSGAVASSTFGGVDGEGDGDIEMLDS